MSEIIYLKPFTKFCMTIGAIPSSYLLSLTYEEQLLWFCDYIQNTIIPTINNNSEAVTEIQNNFNENTQNLLSQFNNLKDYVNSYFNNLDLSEEISNKLDQMAENGQLQELFNQLANQKLNNFSNSNQVELSNDLLTDNTKWITEGWTGSREIGFQHTVGQTSPLIYNENFEVGKKYVLSFDVQSTSPAGAQNASNAFSVIIGNSEPIITYRGGGSMHYDIGLTPKENGNLQFILCNPVDPTQESNIFDGKILNITLKEIISNISQIDIADNNSMASNSFTITPTNDQNTIIGSFAGISNYKQQYNTYLGNNCARNDISGYFNVGIGWHSLYNNINGSRNVSIGYNAHNSNISGDRNVAIGPFAMNTSKTTRRTITIGYDAMFNNETGDNNIAIGGVALQGAKNSINNIAIGHSAMQLPSENLGEGNVAIGNQAMLYANTTNRCIAIGYQAQYKNTSGVNCVSVGNVTLGSLQNGNSMNAFGYGVGNSITNGTCSNLMGIFIINLLKTINQSSIIGFNILNNAQTIENSIIYGRNITSDITELSNVNVFGNNCKINSNNSLNICNIIFGDLSNLVSLPRIGIGVETPSATLHLRGGSNLSQSAPLKFESGTLMTTTEDGAFEYDGSHLYFTIGSERKQIV